MRDATAAWGRLWPSGPGRAFWLAVAVALLLGGAGSASAKVFDRIVAIVNDDIITLSEIEETSRPLLEHLQPQAGVSPGKQAYETRVQVLRMMVDQKLAQQEISRLGISVSREDIDRVIEDVKKENNMTEEQIRAALKDEGMTWEDYRKQVGDQLSRARLVNEQVRTKIVITDEQCRKYYQEKIDKYRVAEEADVQHILLSVAPGASSADRERQRKRAQEALAMLKAGADFATLAKQYSDAPTAADGGGLGWVRIEEMAPYLKTAISGLKAGQMTEVIDTEQGYQVFRVKDYRKGGTKAYEQVKDEIYRDLFQQEVDKAYEAWVTGLRQKAYIKITL